jgi:hypothetical protein
MDYISGATLSRQLRPPAVCEPYRQDAITRTEGLRGK